jgi:hypothetical protein
MPGGDRTGPRGMGPMTGRAAGYCAGYDAPGFAHPYPRRGLGLGWRGGWRGPGRGWRHWYYASGLPGWARGFGPGWGGYPAYGSPVPPTREQEADMLKEQAEWLQDQLDDIQQHLAELEQEE